MLFLWVLGIQAQVLTPALEALKWLNYLLSHRTNFWHRTELWIWGVEVSSQAMYTQTCSNPIVRFYSWKAKDISQNEKVQMCGILSSGDVSQGCCLGPRHKSKTLWECVKCKHPSSACGYLRILFHKYHGLRIMWSSASLLDSAIVCANRSTECGAGEMTLSSRALPALSEDLGLILSTLIVDDNHL